MYLLFISPQGTVKIELAKDDAFALNIQAKDFSIITDKSNMSFYSLGGSVAYVENKERLMQIADKNVSRPFDFVGRTVKCWIVSAGDNYIGDITFTGVNTTNGAIDLVFTFIGGAANWIDSLPEFLNEIDVGETFLETDTFVNTINAYAGAYDSTYQVWFSHKIYETIVKNQPGGDIFQLTEMDLRPDLYFKAIIDALESYTGLNFVSQIFSSEYFKRWLYPFTGTNGVNHRFVTLDTPPAGTTSNLFLDTSSWNEVFDPLGAHTPVTSQFLIHDSWNDVGDVDVSFTLQWDLATVNNAVVHIFDGVDLISLDRQELKLGVNNITLKGTLPTAHYLKIYIEGSISFNSGIINYMSNAKVLVQGVYLVNSTAIRKDLKTIDFLTGITQCLNLVFYHDAKNYRLISETKWGAVLQTGEEIDGFYKHSTFSKNWTSYLDCKNNNFVDISLSAKEIRYRFKEDNKDAYVVDENKFSQLVPIKIVGETKNNVNKIFAPTINIEPPESYLDEAPLSTAAIVPIMGTSKDLLDDVNAKQSFNFLPRMLYKMGKMDWWMNRIDSLNLDFCALAAQQLSVISSSDIIDVDVSARVANLTFQDFETSKGFISLFYQPDILIWKKGGRKQVTVNIPIAQLLDIEKALRHKKHINFKGTGGGTYILESYQIILNKKGLTSVNLIDLGVENI